MRFLIDMKMIEFVAASYKKYFLALIIRKK